MEVSVLLALMSSWFEPAVASPRTRTFKSVSVITGQDVFLRVTTSPDKDRRIAAYRNSPESHLLRLND
jgi:hypothetical protein